MAFHNGHFRFLHSVLSVLVTLTLHQVCMGVCLKESKQRCDPFKGSWVPDKSPQLYDQNSCPFITQDFNCLKNGRTNTTFLNYRWQPSDCSIPRFDAKDFMNRFRGKKILFVGDSLSLDQWQSLTCILHVVAPQSLNFSTIKSPFYEYRIPEYQLTITFMWNPFLVDLDKEKIGKVLKLDSIKNADTWGQNDMLIFNTWHHWVYARHQEFDYMQLGNKIFDDMDRLKAFEIALTTTVQWIDSNINPQKTRVFFHGISALHYNGKEWNQSSGTNCNQENQPITGSIYPAGDPPALAVVKKVLKAATKKIDFLDFTLLTQLRKDGHPQIYDTPDHSVTDCTHWCLPGVPDTWNQLLYAIITS